MISECLEAAGVEQVIWIDDNFARRNRAKCGEVMERALRSLHASSEVRIITIPHFPPFDLNKPLDDVLDDYESSVEGLNDQQFSEAADVIERQAGLEANRPATTDLTIEEISELTTAFGPRLTKQSLAEWTSEGAAKFANSTRNTLFLIDREFEREDTRFDGLEILKSLVDGEAFCIMFTCHCPEDQEEEKRLDYSQKGIDAHKFSVISKLGAKPVVTRFANALRAAFVHRHTGDLANQLATTLIASTNETAATLAAQSVADLDTAIFENSINEGASELDVLLRIFFIQQKCSARTTFKGERLKSILGEMRRFREKTAKHFRGRTPASMDKFRAWRLNEVYEAGDVINPIHSPLCCGDLFACTKHKGATKTFMLLGQPCDLMVRADGKRSADAGLFVLFSESDAGAKESRNAHRFHEIAGILPEGKIWRADFLITFVVDLRVLDYCVFNTDGFARLAEDTAADENMLSSGYERVLSEAKKQIQSVIDEESDVAPMPLSVGERGNKYSATVEGKTVEYPIRRVGRLDSTIAHAVLAAWASYQTRSALDHDFARFALEPEAKSTSNPTQSPATVVAPGPPAAPPTSRDT